MTSATQRTVIDTLSEAQEACERSLVEAATARSSANWGEVLDHMDAAIQELESVRARVRELAGRGS